MEDLEFADVRLRRRRQNVQTHAGRGDRRKKIDSLMPDRLTSGNSAPLLFQKSFNGVKLNPLSTVQPFHRQCAVERDRMIEANTENSMIRTRRRRPKMAGTA